MTYGFTDIATQMAALPMPLQVWVNWLAVVFVPPIFFVRHRIGKQVFALAAVFVLVQTPLILHSGLTGILSLPHLIFWTPMVVLLLRGLRSGEIAKASPFGVWATVGSATAIVSLVFDMRDLARWVAGARAVETPSADAPFPALWAVLIVLGLAAAGWYAFGSSDRRERASS